MKKVMIGMSGGVDSSVAAALLKDQGYDVVGVTFRLWKPQDDLFDSDEGCCSLDDTNDARLVCDRIGIPHYVFNFRDLFRQEVVENFVAEYQAGRTPNPCVVCNRKIKFDHFYQKAKSMGFDYIATGHYARILQTQDGFRLCKAAYDQKDQSYFLYNIPYEKLGGILFPLGELTKPQVRELAEKYGFSVAKKKDSQEICFVDQNGYSAFLEAYTQQVAPKGNFIDTNGNILGTHRGIWHYTVGQRKGLGVTFGKPMYVGEINPKDNTITLVDDAENDSAGFFAEAVSYALPAPLVQPMEIAVKIRNRAPLAKALLIPEEGNHAQVRFREPQRAVTTGQSAVFYDGDVVLGGGLIQKRIR